MFFQATWDRSVEKEWGMKKNKDQPLNFGTFMLSVEDKQQRQHNK